MTYAQFAPLIVLVVGYLVFSFVLLALERSAEVRKFWVARTVAALVVGLLMWKLTPIWTRWDTFFDNPLLLLSMNGGLAAVLGGVFAFLAVATLSLWQVKREKPETKRWRLVVPVAAALAVVVTWVLVEPLVAPRPSPPPAAVQLLVPDLEGRTHSLADYKGRVVIVNFWATWCAPCLAELPEFQAFTQKPSPKVVLLGVDLLATEKDGVASVIRMAAQRKMGWTQLTDPEGALQKAFSVTVIPTTIVLDPEGNVVDRREGAVDLFWLRSLEGRFASR